VHLSSFLLVSEYAILFLVAEVVVFDFVTLGGSVPETSLGVRSQDLKYGVLGVVRKEIPTAPQQQTTSCNQGVS